MELKRNKKEVMFELELSASKVGVVCSGNVGTLLTVYANSLEKAMVYLTMMQSGKPSFSIRGVTSQFSRGEVQGQIGQQKGVIKFKGVVTQQLSIKGCGS